MNNLKFECPHCGQSLDSTIELLGKGVRCPSCRQLVDMPKPVEAVEEPAAEAIHPKIHPRTSVAAIWALVLGILSIPCFWCLGIIVAIPAIVCGHMSRANIKKAGGALKGSGMATTGLILGYLAILAAVVYWAVMGPKAVEDMKKAYHMAMEKQRAAHQQQSTNTAPVSPSAPAQ